VLEFRADGTVVTGDKPAGVVLGRLPAAMLEALGPKMRPGMLLRFALGAGGVALGPDGMPTGADLEWLGVDTRRRGGAHPFSRIVSQWQLRTHQAILFEALLAAVERGGDDDDGEMGMCGDDAPLNCDGGAAV